MAEPRPQQDLLERLLTGELDPQGEEARRALEDPALRARYEELVALARGLDDVARERDEILREVKTSAVEGEERVLARFRAMVPPLAEAAGPSATDRPDRRRRRSLLLLLPLAAALLVAAWWVNGRPQPGPAHDPPLGSAGGLELLAPIGPVPEIKVFRWKPFPGAVTYRVILYDQSDPVCVPLPEIEHSSQVSRTEYVPQRPLPARVLWRVQAFDGSGGLLGQGQREAVVTGSSSR